MTNLTPEISAPADTAHETSGPAAVVAPLASSPVAPASPCAAQAAALADQEVDVWWGSYSGWTMLPSFLVCILLTVCIGWFAWTMKHRELMHLTFLGVGGAVWMAQTIRWSYRCFGFNYRLTTRRLFQDKGFLYLDRWQAELAGIADVKVERNGLERLIGVGRVCICLKDSARPPLVLEGVRKPTLVADMIRQGSASTPSREGSATTKSTLADPPP